MGKLNVYQQAFNAGVTDKDKLPRVDLERMRVSAEDQTNLLATTVGKMFLRPGFEYLGQTADADVAQLRPFIFGATDAAVLELSDEALRVWVDDEIVTRPSVTSSVTNGDFSAATGWTTTDTTTGATASISGGKMTLKAAAHGSLAVCKQSVSTSSSGTLHALRIVVAHGPVTFRCGSTDGGDDYISETVLFEGTHSLAFTPTGTYYIRFQSNLLTSVSVDSIDVEDAGVMSLPTPWTETDLGLVRMAQSADVVFCACKGHPQQRIERRGAASWSVVRYYADDGPFTIGTTASVKLRPGALEGNTTLSADRPFFHAKHVGALFRLNHSGSHISTSLAADGAYTPAIRVSGINGTLYDDRDWDYAITGTWEGTLHIERSFDSDIAGFQRFPFDSTETNTEITENKTGTIGDDDDNAIVWYRIGFPEDKYTSGTADVAITYDGGGGAGICRVTGFTSATQVSIEVLKEFKQTTSTSDWQEGEWSDWLGYPSAVSLADGRLWWSGTDRIWGSVSDGFASFDDTIDGDSGPIIRSIATGGVNSTQWIMSLQRLLFGSDGAVTTAKSSSLDEPLAPDKFSLKDCSTTGSAPVTPVRIDGNGMFVERAGNSIHELTYDAAAADYQTTELSKLTTDLFTSGVKQVAVQRRPDTRVWVVCNDGSMVCIVYEPSQQNQVLAFIPIVTDGDFESVAVLPAATQDRVYAVVKRTVDGSTVRYVEKMAPDSAVKPDTTCKVFDAFAVVSNSTASTAVSGLDHLEGKTVCAWADGAPVTGTENGRLVAKEFTVSDGAITLPEAASDIVVGLPYTGRYKSARLAYAAQGGTAMLQKKQVQRLGLILTDFVRDGIFYGAEFDNTNHPLDRMPVLKDGKTAPQVVLSTVSEEETFSFDGAWDTDSRVCIEVASPFTASFLGLVMTIETNG